MTNSMSHERIWLVPPAVPEDEGTEVECKRCHGLGEDPVYQGSDCTNCEGWGSVILT